MAIQGIIQGYADPRVPAQNLILIGRGDRYLVVEDGRARDSGADDFDAAMRVFQGCASQRCQPGWRGVSGATMDSVGGAVVTHLNARLFQVDFSSAEGDEAVGQEFNRDRG